jgi:hypothetical protein
MLREGRTAASGYLLLYNLAFVLPLPVIFILAFHGMKSEALLSFQKRHTALVRFATALLFLALFLLLLLT